MFSVGWSKSNRRPGERSPEVRPAGLDNDRHLFGRPRQARVEPAAAVLAKGIGFVEEHQVVPLRALGLMDGQRVSIGELVRLAAEDERDLLFGSLEETL